MGLSQKQRNALGTIILLIALAAIVFACFMADDATLDQVQTLEFDQ